MNQQSNHAFVFADFIDFVTNQEQCRIKWLEAEQRVVQLQTQVSGLETDNEVLRTKLKHVRYIHFSTEIITYLTESQNSVQRFIPKL